MGLARHLPYMGLVWRDLLIDSYIENYKYKDKDTPFFVRKSDEFAMFVEFPNVNGIVNKYATTSIPFKNDVENKILWRRNVNKIL
jgi:hypothetical protein